MEQPPKPKPTLAEQIAVLRDGHEALNDRLDDQAEELRENTRTTKRVEEKTARIIELFEDASGFVRTLALVADWGKKIAWLTVPWAFILGGARAAWHWISGGLG